MDLTLISPPLTRSKKLDVVSVEDVKRQARISHTEEDFLIADYIEAAYDYLAGPDGWLNHMDLLPQRYEIRYTPRYGNPRVELPMRPLLSGDDFPVTYEYHDGVTFTTVGVPAFLPFLNEPSSFPVLGREPTAYFPFTAPTAFPQHRVRFWAGFPSPDRVPSTIKQAIRMLAAHFYSNRETIGPDGRAVGQEVPYGLRNLCGRYKVALNHS